MYDLFMVVGNTDDFSWWLATHMTFHGGWQRVYDVSWWLATHMIFHGGCHCI